MLEKTLESPLDIMEIKPVNPKRNDLWIFLGRTDAEAEASILWPHDAKSRLIGKDPDPGKDWRQEEKGMTENEMVGWYHWLNRHEFEQSPGDGEGQGSLVSKGSQRHDWATEQLHCLKLHCSPPRASLSLETFLHYWGVLSFPSRMGRVGGNIYRRELKTLEEGTSLVVRQW